MKIVIDIPETTYDAICTITTLAELGSVSNDTIKTMYQGIQKGVQLPEGKIADTIYEELSYMYCDNCRYIDDSIDEYDVDHCENCHRKYNGWAVSKEVAEQIERECLKEKKGNGRA